MLRASALALALTLALSLSCAGGPNKSGTTAIAPREKSTWRATFDAHTRRDQSWKWAVRQADVRATLITPALRKAFLDARPEFQGRFADETERELIALGEPDPGVDVESRPKPESEEQVIFFVAMYVTDQKNRDIGASYSIWNTTLHRGTGNAASPGTRPLKIETVKASPAVMDIFPTADRFDDLYLVRFPLTDSTGKPFVTPGAEPLTLRIESALAKLEMQWTLAE